MAIFIKYIETWPQILPDDSVSLELEDLKIEDPDNFGFSLLLTICEDTDPPSGDDHRIYVCTRKYYDLGDPETRKMVRVQKHVFVDRFDPAEIRKTLEKMVADCDKGTMKESLPLLRKRFDWEYEYFNQLAPSELH